MTGPAYVVRQLRRGFTDPIIRAEEDLSRLWEKTLRDRKKSEEAHARFRDVTTREERDHS